MLLLLTSFASAGPAFPDAEVLGLPDGIDAPCSTPSKWGVNAIEPVWPTVPPPPDGKGVRDAYGGDQAFTLEGEHFVLKWDTRVRLADETAQHLLDALEQSWDVEIDDMGHAEPMGSDAYLFNVYIGNSGNNVPSIRGAAAYYTNDEQGWPMIVVNPDTLADNQFTKITAAHEFYHAVQGAADRYNYQPNGPSAWFWESTATWASSLVFPDNPRYVVFLFGYAFYPHFPVNFFDYPDSGAVTEYYQYGAFIFPKAISDELGSWDAIADTWKDSGSISDPLEVLRLKLAQEDVDLNAVWMKHNARNAMWDYDDGDAMRVVLGQYSQQPGYDNMVAGSIPSSGMTEAARSPKWLAPMRYGYNTFTMINPADGDLLVTIDGDAAGTSGSPGQYGGYVVRDMGAGVREYHEVVFDGLHGELLLEDVGDENRLYLVVGSWTPFLGTSWQSETFGYSYQAQIILPPEPEPVDPEPEPKACGCDASSGPLALWALLPVALVGLARRRRTSTV